MVKYSEKFYVTSTLLLIGGISYLPPHDLSHVLPVQVMTAFIDDLILTVRAQDQFGNLVN